MINSFSTLIFTFFLLIFYYKYIFHVEQIGLRKEINLSFLCIRPGKKLGQILCQSAKVRNKSNLLLKKKHQVLQTGNNISKLMWITLCQWTQYCWFLSFLPDNAWDNDKLIIINIVITNYVHLNWESFQKGKFFDIYSWVFVFLSVSIYIFIALLLFPWKKGKEIIVC